MITTIKHIPLFLQNIYEFKKITDAVDIELNNLQAITNSILSETTIQGASEYGISRYEKIFDVNNIENSLNERKFVIQSTFSNRIPFTLNWLRSKLNKLVGEGNYTIDMDYDNYNLIIRISYLFPNAVNFLKKDLRKSIPANIELEVYQNQNEMVETYIAGATVQSCFEELYEK